MDFTKNYNDSDNMDNTFEDEEEWTQVMNSICNTEKHDHHIDYMMGGVRVKFPKTAYKSQELMMGCMIDGAQKSENCLLESPTGTGKTLAILCALLAWQERCKNKKDWGHTIDEATLKTGCTCGFMQGDPSEFVITQRSLGVGNIVLEKYSYEYVVIEEEPTDHDNTENTDTTDSSSPKKKKNEVKRRKSDPDEQRNEYQLCRFCIRTNYKSSTVPVIYYATRTISQVDQVVKELKSTAYSSSKMTVLAGRSTYCANLNVTQPHLTVDDECHKLRENHDRNAKSINKKLPECDYYQGGTKGGNIAVYNKFFKEQTTAWDIEDLKLFSRRNCGCAYYGAKILQERADIVFCTYNYLLHAGIRKIGKIDLINNVIVFDEAHNIEDLCRDLSSLEVTQYYIDRTVIPAFQEVLKNGATIPPIISPIMNEFLNLFTRLSAWIDTHCEKIEFNIKMKQEDYREISPDKIVRELNELGLGVDNICDLRANCEKLEEAVLGKLKDEKLTKSSDTEKIVPNETLNDNSTMSTQNVASTWSNNPSIEAAIAKGSESPEMKLNFSLTIIRYVKNMVETLGLMFGEGKGLPEDYKAIMLKKVNNVATFKTITFSNEFHILCLNPAVAFKQLRNCAHSIVVTSGTLYPLDTFESELNTPFTIKLSAPHVIQSSQVMSSVLRCGPELKPLNFVKGNQHNPDYQDELGRVIINVCRVVPHGVLIFFPSYSWLEQLKFRWEKFPGQYPILHELRSLKKVYFEDSKMNKEEFKKYMEDYQANIVDNSSGGCVLFAVFRGKVSEGIDFKDDQARAVLTVGIPYSNPGNAKTCLKKQYNDAIRKKKKRNVLSGMDWYTTQAFRAMNQAFGRCVRHKNDWGSIILLEDRMAFPRNKSYLSEWVRRELKCFQFSQFETMLKKFVDDKENSNHEVSLCDENFENFKMEEDLGQETQINDVISPEAPIAPHRNTYDIETYPSPQRRISERKTRRIYGIQSQSVSEMLTQRISDVKTQSISEMETQKVRLSDIKSRIIAINPSEISTKKATCSLATIPPDPSTTKCQCFGTFSKGDDFHNEGNSSGPDVDGSVNDIQGSNDDSILGASEEEMFGPSDDEMFGPSDDESDAKGSLIASSQSSSVVERLRKSIYVVPP